MASHDQRTEMKRVRFAGLPDVEKELHEAKVMKVKGVRNSSQTPHRPLKPSVPHDEALTDYYRNYFDSVEDEELQDVLAPVRQLHVLRPSTTFPSSTPRSKKVDRKRDGLSERQRELRLDKPPERLPSDKPPAPLRSRAPLRVRDAQEYETRLMKAISDAEDGSFGDNRKARSLYSSLLAKTEGRAGKFSDSRDTKSHLGKVPSALKSSFISRNESRFLQSSVGEQDWPQSSSSQIDVAEHDDSHTGGEDRAASKAAGLENSSETLQTEASAALTSFVEFADKESREAGERRRARAAERLKAARLLAENCFETIEPRQMSETLHAWQLMGLEKTEGVVQGGEDSFSRSTKEFGQELAEELRIGVTKDWKRPPLPSFSLDIDHESASQTHNLATQGLTPKRSEQLEGRVPTQSSEDPSHTHGSSDSNDVEPMARHEVELDLQAIVPLRPAVSDPGRQPSIPIASEEQEVLPSTPAKTPEALALTMQLYTTCTELASRLIVFNAPTLWRRPPVPSGMKRIEWICTCGRKLYDDYTELKPGALDSLQLRLNRRSGKRSHPSLGLRLPLSTDSSSHHDGKPNDRTATHSSAQRDHNGSETSHGTIGTALWAAFGKLLSGSEAIEESLPQHSSNNRVEAGNFSTDKHISRQIDLQYLLLCVPFKRHASKLLNVNTSSSVISDANFFQLLRHQYIGHRGRFRHIFSLRGLSEIRFVHFEVFRKDLTDVRGYDCVQPETQKDRYVYSPMPAEYMPPIGVNRMMHLYEHPEDAEDSPMYFPMVPRKLRERLLVSPAKRRDEGWEICFVEGLSWSRICVFGLVGILATTAFGVAWTVVMDDIQGGFGVASYMLGVLVLGLGALQGAFEM